MLPKKKGSSKKPPKAKSPTLIDGLTKEELTKEQMEEHAMRLREELDRVRKEKNYFQLERDKVHTFMEATERKLDEAKAKLMNLDKEIEEDEKNHQEEIKVFKQKMKHLLCEHQNTICELKADADVSTQAMQTEQKQIESELSERKGSIELQIEMLDISDTVKELELEHEGKMTETAARSEKQLQETEAKYEKQMEELLQELEDKRKKEISEMEDQWSNHVVNLKKDHSEAMGKLTALMQMQVLDDSLEDQLKESREKLEATDKKLRSILQDNKRLSECLSNVNKEIAATKKRINPSGVIHSDAKVDLETVRIKELSKLKKKHEILEQSFTKLQLERDELKDGFSQNIQRVQHRASQKSEELEEKLKSMMDALEDKQAQIDSVLSSSMVDQTALQGVINQIENQMSRSKNSIKDLQHKRSLIAQAKKDLQLYVKETQRASGVPAQSL